jgi:inorganic phosphate transporter, PiT family
LDIKTIEKINTATTQSISAYTKFSLALLFVALVFAYSYAVHMNIENNTFLIIGAVFGAYMAMNIGANDVANNVGPAVGSKALTMTGAIILAATFEAMGAFVAGGDVVKTIKDGIINPDMIADPQIFVWAMTAALLAAAIWLNLATFVGAPVSTTHSIVGGVMGAGIAAAGFSIVAWGTMGKIAMSWIISPILGGIVAAGFLFFIKKTIVYKADKIGSAKKIVPYLIAFMAWAFSTYLILKGMKSLFDVNFFGASAIGILLAIGTYFIVKLSIEKSSAKMLNKRESINTLFNIPLVFAAALLSFAHGANDVANAIGPLAAIYDAVTNNEISAKVGIPFWVMAVGALGIVVGLVLYGPKLIKTVGSEITELDQIRAFSIAMAAAITVIIASQLGLPVSSTHIAIGGVFGVGFLREYLDSSESVYISRARKRFRKDKKELESYEKELLSLELIKDKSKGNYQRIVALHKLIDDKIESAAVAKKNFQDAKSIKYVKRDAIKKIIAAWIITVPTAALLSAAVFFMIKGIMS